jgi:hypothetical protein
LSKPKLIKSCREEEEEEEDDDDDDNEEVRSQFLQHTDYILDCNEVKLGSPRSNFRV